MGNYKLESNEVVLYEDVVAYSEVKGELKLILTSQKIIFEKEKGLISKGFCDIINLEDIKIYNEKAQVHKKGSEVSVQTINKNIKISFDGMFKANKFVTKLVDAITGTTITERGTNKIKAAINTVDDILGIDTRNTLKEVVENGVASTLLMGIKKNKK